MQNDPLKPPTFRRRPRGLVMTLFALFVAFLVLAMLAPQPDLFQAIAEQGAL